MGITFQFPEEQFLRESIAEEFSDVLSLRSASPSTITPRMEEALAAVGLDPKIFPGRSPFTLSLGESRRVALALVLASRPEAVIMDEPTAGLDASGIAVTASALKKLHRAGATIIIASHDLGFAADCARRVLLLDRGKITADSTTNAILSNRSLLRSYGYAIREDVTVGGLQEAEERSDRNSENKQKTRYINHGNWRQPEL
jgi:energy-coupling factor transport system ATP-binding protein